jgi:hypothetical protein
MVAHDHLPGDKHHRQTEHHGRARRQWNQIGNGKDQQEGSERAVIECSGDLAHAHTFTGVAGQPFKQFGQLFRMLVRACGNAGNGCGGGLVTHCGYPG